MRLSDEQLLRLTERALSADPRLAEAAAAATEAWESRLLMADAAARLEELRHLPNLPLIYVLPLDEIITELRQAKR